MGSSIGRYVKVGGSTASQPAGAPRDAVAFSLRPPRGDVEAGGTIQLELRCTNRSATPIHVFGFNPAYPRSLRVSPPKESRPWIRVSFGDSNVLHPLEAFVRLEQGDTVTTTLDLSFAFDRRGAGRWDIGFAYQPVKATVGVTPWIPHDHAETEVVELLVSRARSLSEAGIGEAEEAAIDALLLRGETNVAQDLQRIGPGGPLLAARRIARIVSSGTESTLGWRALDALGLLGEEGLDALHRTAEDLPHARRAFEFGIHWIAHRLGQPAPPQHARFVEALDQVCRQPDSRGNFLLAWTPYDSPIHGSRRLEALGNGDCVVTSRAPDAAVTTTHRTRLRPLEMQSLLDAVRYSAVWLLGPFRERGLPDEPRPGLEVQVGLGEPFRRSVAMWNGEWHHGPASTLADLLQRISADRSPGEPASS